MSVLQRAGSAALAPIVVAAALQPAIAAVRPLPAPPRVVNQAAPLSHWRHLPPGPHIFYGTIAAINGTILRVRLRNGRLRDFDATATIASDNYSSPLFVGKQVTIDGNVSDGVFTVAHVFRLTTLNDLPADH